MNMQSKWWRLWTIPTGLLAGLFLGVYAVFVAFNQLSIKRGVEAWMNGQ